MMWTDKMLLSCSLTTSALVLCNNICGGFNGYDLTFFGNQYVSTATESICAGSKFSPECGLNEVIVIENATYGRMEQGKCVKLDLGHLGCNADVVYILTRRCSGRRTCTVTVPDQELVNTRPCSELESYLRVHYICVKVISAQDYPCSSQNILKVIPEQGIISSLRQQSKCDSATNTVWLIEGQAGQRINVTLTDFSFQSVNSNDLSNREPGSCMTYVRDFTSDLKMPLCGGTQLTSHVMFSEGNAVEIIMEQQKFDDVTSQYLLSYKMVGCPDPPVGANSWIDRSGKTVTIGCNHSPVTHQMKCVGTKWQGSYYNCTDQGDNGTDKFGNKNLTLDFMPRGLVITAVLAIAVVVGVAIVVVGMFCVKRQRRDLLGDGRGSCTPHNIDTIPHHCRNTTGNKDSRGNYWIEKPPLQQHQVPAGSHSIVQDQYRQIASPTLQRCYQYTETPTHTLSPSEKRHVYTHVWDRPLPAPESQHSC